VFPVQAEALPAGGEHDHIGACPAHRLDQLGDRFEEVLAVVDYDQQLLGAQELDQGLLQRHPAAGRHAEHRGEGGCHPVGVAHRRQLHQPRTFPKAR
jgi:hypothetical protein